MNGVKNLKKLPNLYSRSLSMLFLLYGMLGLLLITASEFFDLALGLVLGVGVFVSLLQFLISPWLMDILLRGLYRLEWTDPTKLPPHLSGFINTVCRKYRFKFPKIGIIDDGAPQAFTYGISPNYARVVISKGILQRLEKEEIDAVMAHELGHVVHWDMILMTFVQLVPLFFYYFYRLLINKNGKRNSKKNKAAVLALIAYVLYILSEYIVLWFSRTREYLADRFSAKETQNPNALASALIKIAYGLTLQAEKKGDQETEDLFKPIETMGIFDQKNAKEISMICYSTWRSGNVDKDTQHLKGAMQWDLWNPWAKWYEWHSTHPLVARRLVYLADYAISIGQTPYVNLEEEKRKRYGGKFVVDVLMSFLPSSCYALILLLIFLTWDPEKWAAFGNSVNQGSAFSLFGALLILTGTLILIKHRFIYPSSSFHRFQLSDLISAFEVSKIRPIPCLVEGKIIGKGEPGYIASHDFVIQDATGIMFLRYQQPFQIWEFLFGLLKANRFQGKRVKVHGWYHRAPLPYIIVKSLESDGDRITSYVPKLYQLFGMFLWVVGILMSVVSLY